MDRGRRGSILVVVLIVVIVLLIGGWVWYYMAHANLPSDQVKGFLSNINNAGESSSTALSVASITWATYVSTSSDFSIQYPADWYVQETSRVDASTSFEISPVPPVPSGEVDMSKGYAYVSIEPQTCEIFYATDFSDSQVSDVSINGLPMVKIHTAQLNNTSSPEDSGRFDLYLFSGDVNFGWDNSCNTIRLYAPGIDESAGASYDMTSTQEVAQTEAIEDHILQSFTFK